MNKLVRLGLLCGLVGMPVCAWGADTDTGAGEQKDIIVVSIAPLEHILEDVKYIGTLGNRPELADTVNGGIAFMTGGKGLKGLDRKRPWGMIVTSDGQAFNPVGVLPVTALKDLLASLENVVGKAEKDGDIYEISPPNSQQSVFVKQAGNWAYLSNNAESFESLPKDPGAALGGLTGRGYDLGAKILCENLSEQHKAMFMGFIEQGMAQGMSQEEDESEDEYKARQKVMELQKEQIRKGLDEFKELSMGMLVDSGKGEARMEGLVSAKDGTDMDKDLSSVQMISPMFGSLWNEASAATFQFCVGVSPEAAERGEKQIKQAQEQIEAMLNGNAEIKKSGLDKVLKKLLPKFMDLAMATAKKGRSEFAAQMNMGEKAFDLTAAAFVADGAKVEEIVRELDTEVKAKSNGKYPGVKFDSGKIGDVELHTLTIPVPADEEEARKMFGDTLNILVGTGPTEVYVTLGKDGKGKLEKLVSSTDSSSSAAKAERPFKGRLSLIPILTFASSVSEEAGVEMAAKILKESPGKDGVRLDVDIKDGEETIVYTLEEGLLRLMARSPELAASQNGGDL